MKNDHRDKSSGPDSAADTSTGGSPDNSPDAQQNAMSAAASDPLLAEFTPPPPRQAWLAEVESLLQGASFASRLNSATPEGITLQPLYMAADVPASSAWQMQPGSPPYLRGNRAAGYRHHSWHIAQELPYPDPQEFNAAVRHDLVHGQTAVNLVLDAASQMGWDPDGAAPDLVGQGGTSVASLRDLGQALAGVNLATTPIYLQAGPAAPSIAAMLMAHCRQHGYPVAQLQGSVGCDPLGELVTRGELPWSLDCAFDQLAWLTHWARKAAPEVCTLVAHDTPYIEGGGNAVHSLAFTLATAVSHMRELMQRGLSCDDIAPRIQFGFTVGNHFFMEIAKLRAARTLWSQVVAVSGGNTQAQKMTMHVRSCDRSRTCFDPHVNLLRGTTEGLAAILGGCDSLHISSFDSQLGLPDDFSRRLARNTQLILLHECHLDRVVDPAGGSWYVENLSAELAARAWSLFQEIEAAGGMIAALEQGIPQRLIDAAAQARQADVNRRQDVLVGTTLFPNADEIPLAPRLSDLSVFGVGRQETFRQVRGMPGQTDRTQVDADLQRIISAPFENRFEATVAAVEHGATLTDLTLTLNQVAGTPPRITSLIRRRDAAGFESLRRAVLTWRAQRSSDPQVFLANVGTVAETTARRDFARAFCEVGGLAVAADVWFPSAAEALPAAISSKALVVIIVTSDARQSEVVLTLAAGLKSQSSAPVVVVAGVPGKSEESFRTAGVDLFIQRDSDALAILRDLTAHLGVVL